MSDVSQGPGWWLASDGRWYPPEQHPQYTAPPAAPPPAPPAAPPAAPFLSPPPSPYAAGGAYDVPASYDVPGSYVPVGGVPVGQGPPRTNGMAIASLVCSLVGIVLAGIPAVVGVILGFVSRAQIRRSNGAQTGAGLALSGIIVGFVEIAVAAFLIVALVGFVETQIRQDQIAGAPGYTTITGPVGKPLAEGRPWGVACQPIVFEASSAVPPAVYTQLEDVVVGARTAGVDVTLATRADLWYPSALYPSGLTNRSVQLVSVYATEQTPPLLGKRGAEHILFEWNARPTRDGGHQYLTYLQAEFFLKALSGPAADRLAARQLVAFSQGVAASSASGSGIAAGTTLDRFSAEDIAAMARMSGCHPPP